MHEFSIMQALFQKITEAAEQNHLQSIQTVHLKIGKLRQVVPDFLVFAFETMSEGTVAEGAELIIEQIPIRLSCKACSHVFEVEHNTYECPACHAYQLELLSGKEIYLDSIEGEK